MKGHKYNVITALANTVREHPIATGVGAVVLSGVIGCGTSSESSAPVAIIGSPSANVLVVPSAWPSTSPLDAVDCTWGKPITHQSITTVDGVPMAKTDTRCEPPESQPYAGVYPAANYDQPAVGRIYNGQWVALQCDIPDGTKVGDDRGPEKTAEWVKVAFHDQDRGGALESGNVSVANLGQLVVAGSMLPQCP